MKSFPALLLSLLAPLALAGGSNYGTPAGTPARFAGQVSEWPVPTPAFARDPAVAPDGSIFIAVMQGNKVARFDPATQPSMPNTLHATVRLVCARLVESSASDHGASPQ